MIVEMNKFVNYMKYVKCQKSETAGQWMRFIKRNFENLIRGGSKIIRSILRLYVKVIQITQKHFMNILRSFDDKIYFIISEPHNVKFIFYESHR